MPILISAFAPFGGEAINPAQLVLARLPDSLNTSRGSTPLVKIALPTAYDQAADILLAAIDEHQPAVVISLGQAGGRPAICLERVAINLKDSQQPDNLGQVFSDAPIVPGAPAAYFSTLPLKKMQAALKVLNIPITISNTAGTYVCNQVIYTALHHIAVHKLPALAGFIHLPYLPEQANTKTPQPPAMELADMLRGVQAMVEAL